MPSDDLFGGMYARGAGAALTGKAAWLQALLDVEAALARACADEDLIPSEAAEAIAAVCHADAFDAAAIACDAAAHASPVVPLVRALREAVARTSPGTCTWAPPVRTSSTRRRC